MAFKGTSSDVAGAEVNLIGKGTRVEGEIHAESSIRIDGKLKGKLVCKSTLTVGQGGEIEGEIEANNANISGKLKGKIIIKQKLVLESTSTLIGDLQAAKLIVDEGAVFDGTSQMGQKGDAPAGVKLKNNKDVPTNSVNS